MVGRLVLPFYISCLLPYKPLLFVIMRKVEYLQKLSNIFKTCYLFGILIGIFWHPLFHWFLGLFAVSRLSWKAASNELSFRNSFVLHVNVGYRFFLTWIHLFMITVPGAIVKLYALVYGAFVNAMKLAFLGHSDLHVLHCTAMKYMPPIYAFCIIFWCKNSS